MNKPKIYIKPDVYDRMEALYDIAENNEFLMFLWTELDNNCNIVVKDAYLPYQWVNGTHCEVTEDGHIDLTKLGVEKFTSISGIFHSHNTMESFLSSSDHKFLDSIISDNMEYFISIVVGKTGFNATIRMLKPFNTNIEAEVVILRDEELFASCKKEFAEKVEIREYKLPKYTKGFLSYNYDDVYKNIGRRFSIENPLYNTNGVPICCGSPMAYIGTSKDGKTDEYYCQYCINTVGLVRGAPRHERS